ncbi:enoyl-CoA hydratase/isomerase family protein [Halogeometricum limi]|uniref:Enoyl-CoA hydratase/carnithine racemase n=1 Tax=Halogeometricum limi TaxID=555875 RepID=A0A1I6IB25_9EURY|nr:enoyl-CoA hydratase/isomerase family protein [Halogeometricum limi]SFR63942.1 Enoyl-CoA hydratase/carnithine racemase [Halogeometricum limi]
METFAELDLENFETEMDGHVGIVRLNKPPANAHNADMVFEFQKMVETIRFDDTVRCAVLSSTSDKFFSSGYDIQALQDESPEHIGYASQTSKESILKMRSTDTIFVSAIDGHCMGGGLEFALATDIRYAGDDDNYNMGVPEINLGLIPGEAGTQLLPRYVGISKALKMMLKDERLTPSEAQEAGIVDELVEPGTAEEEAIEFAKHVASLPNQAVGHIKVAVNEGMEMSLYDALAHERELQNQLFDTPGAKEGISAFLEKREPNFIEAELGEDAITSDDD